MTWVRLDDQFPDHPKVVKAGPLAGWLHVCGIAYCNRHLTDGFIPRGVAHRLTDFTNIGLELGGNEMVAFGDDVSCAWMANILVDVGLWRRTEDGYEIHDYLDFQPSKAEVEAEREQKRAAGRLGGKRSAQARAQASGQAGASAGAQAERQAESKPVPVPAPEQAKEEKGNGSSNGHEEGLPFDKQLQVSRMLAGVNNADADTASVIQALAMPLPLSSLVKVRESVERHGKVGAGYVVNALKSERSEAMA